MVSASGNMVSEFGTLSFAVAAIAYLVLGGLLLTRQRQSAPSLWLIAACFATFAWAVAVLLGAGSSVWARVGLTIAETIRSALWVIVAGVLVLVNWEGGESNPSRRVLTGILVVVGFVITVDVFVLLTGGLPGSVLAYAYVLGRLVVAIGGLLVTHNLYVNSAPANRWSIRLLCIGLAAIFGYDLNLYTLQLLNQRLSLDLYEVRGIANALVVPLIYLSVARNRGLKLQLSRQAAFHTFSLGAVGVYLVAMSLAGYGLRLVGGDWGRFLQISFVFAMALLAAVVLFSGRTRAWLRVQINKHFFAYKYDYRQEWLRFVSTVANVGPGMGELHARVVQAVCEPVDSPGGALFGADEAGEFSYLTRWNYRTLAPQRIDAATGLAGHFAESGRIIDLDEVRQGAGSYGTLNLPRWIVDDAQAWLIIPLVHIDAPIGFILVERSLARRVLNWEDFDILRTLGRQAASYVAEAAALARIAESRKFDEFNRRFAFIMHDLKNLVSQLSLVARNAERHADNPEFRADMVATLQSSVSKMNDLLARLSNSAAPAPEADVVDVNAVVAEVVAAKRGQRPEVLVAGSVSRNILGSREKLEQILTHLVQNAIDASPSSSPVNVRLHQGTDEVSIVVEDRGVGMTSEFVRSELFEPFRSTKSGGFGIGAFEARAMIREMGGNLVVRSEPGQGSAFTIHLPAMAGERDQIGRDS